MNSDPESAFSTVDAFHRGRFVVVQPSDGGHRSGIDAMLLAGAVPTDFSGHVVDLGAGAGAAGLAVISRCEKARATLAEKNPDMVAHAKATLKHDSNQWLATRACVIESDVSSIGRARESSGLADNHFDFAIMNPPFNRASDRQTPDVRKAQAHVMTEGLFEDWLRTAAAIVKAKGSVAVIARPQSIGDILSAMTGRFGGVRIVPVHPRPDAEAIRIIVVGVKGSRAHLSFHPPLILHGETSRAFTDRAEAICNGLSGLFE